MGGEILTLLGIDDRLCEADPRRHKSEYCGFAVGVLGKFVKDLGEI